MKEITKEELEELYNSRPNKEVCEILGVTNPTLMNYLKHFGIKPKGMGNKKGRIKKIALKV